MNSSFRWTRALVGAALCVGGVAFGGCSSDSKTTPSRLAVGCSLDSDCEGTFKCTFGRCHVACQSSKDCSGGRCVYTGEDHVCQLEQEARCLHNTDCVAPLACAVDAQCRNQCNGDRDCVSGQKCVSSGVCADPDELENGDLHQVLAMDPHLGTGGTSPGTGGTGPDSGVPNGSGGTSGAGGSLGGSGGAGNGGSSGGAVGNGGSGPVDGGVVSLDPCAPGDGGYAGEPIPNDDRLHATHLSLGQTAQACMQSGKDIDFYEFSAPANSAQGGYMVVRLSDVALTSNLHMSTYAAADNTEMLADYNGSSGGDIIHWVAVDPGMTLRAAVTAAYENDSYAGAYSITAKFIDATEPGEPNDVRSSATPITVGKSVNGRFFAGHQTSANPEASDWLDWYSVTLPVGTVSAAVTNVPQDTAASVLVTDSAGTPLANYVASAADGADAVFTHAIATAGTYYVQVTVQYCCSDPKGRGPFPKWATDPYSLQVTMQ